MSIQDAVRELLKGREVDLIQSMIGNPAMYKAPQAESAEYLVDLMWEHDPQRLVDWTGIYLYDTSEVSS